MRKRSLADLVLRLARRLVPAEQRDWAAAMLGELDEVPNGAGRILWAFGCLWATVRMFAAGPDGELAKLCLPLLTLLAILDWNSPDPTLTLIALVVVPGLLAYCYPERRWPIGIAFGTWLLALHMLADVLPSFRPEYRPLPLTPFEVLEIASLLAATSAAAAIGAWNGRSRA